MVKVGSWTDYVGVKLTKPTSELFGVERRFDCFMCRYEDRKIG